MHYSNFDPVLWEIVLKTINTISAFLLVLLIGYAVFLSSRAKSRAEFTVRNAFLNWQRAKREFVKWALENPNLGFNVMEAQEHIQKELGALLLLKLCKPLTNDEEIRERVLTSLVNDKVPDLPNSPI